MDNLGLFQQAFSTLTSALASSTAAMNVTDTAHNGTSTVPLPLGTSGPALTTALLSMLLSYSALRDWLKLLIIGTVMETSRRLFLHLWQNIQESFWITACFDDDDESYNWIMHWLSNQPKWTTARVVDVSTRTFGLRLGTPVDEGSEGAMRKPRFLPSLSETYSFWYKGHYVKVTRSQRDSGAYSKTDVLHINILARSIDVLNSLIKDTMTSYSAAQEHTISIFVSESNDYWRHAASRPKRPLKSIILDPGIKDLLLNDARDFLTSKSWYQERGIPFRRGYLLYGAPGSGKTSMIHSLAGELGLDVYVVSLSRSGMDDSALMKLLAELPERCIALMEDIDAAFQRGITRKRTDDLAEEEEAEKAAKGTDSNQDNSVGSSKVTLSGLLNALDGVAAHEGRILFATTNCYSALDPALCRPGRMDLHVEFKLASKYQAAELFKCFYLPSQVEVEEQEKTDDEKSLSAEKCGEDNHSDSGYSSLPSSLTPSENGDVPLLERSSSSSSTSSSTSSAPVLYGSDHRLRAPRLSREEIHAFAARFAEGIPDRVCSMASLQGFLMTYKTRPEAAAEDVQAWVEREFKKKRRTKRSRSQAKTGNAATSSEEDSKDVKA